jgi:hypothetical protein
MVLLPLAQNGVALTLWALGRRPGGLRGWWTVQAAALAAALPVALWAIPALLTGYPTAFAPQPLGDMARVLFLRLSLHTEVWPSPLVLAPFLAALAAAGWGALRAQRSDRSGRGPLALAVWLAAPVLAVWLAAPRFAVFLHRYLMLIVPAYYLFLGCGAATLRARRAPLGWLCGGGLALAMMMATARPAEVRPDFRSAAAYVATRAAPGDRALFVAGYGERAFRYYLPADRLPGAAAPYANDGVSPTDQAAELAPLVGPPGSRVWLIEYEDWLWDSRGLAVAWLGQRGAVVEAVNFPGVRVTAFALDAG